jgi:hypothetical protein
MEASLKLGSIGPVVNDGSYFTNLIKSTSAERQKR